ncbi:MAG: hypothetical protein PHQ27_03420 [Victivallales bacterium]|nr:hypothetical protein [Victivallales bacterium]
MTRKSDDGEITFFPEQQQQTFTALLAELPERIVETRFHCGQSGKIMRLTINSPTRSRLVYLHYHPDRGGNHVIAKTESSEALNVPRLFLMLQVPRWDDHPTYTPALNDEMRLVLGCSRRLPSLVGRNDFYDLTVGLADAVDRIETIWTRHSFDLDSWCNTFPASLFKSENNPSF